MTTDEAQVIVPYEKYNELVKTADEHTIKITHYMVDEYPPITSTVQYGGKDDAIKKLIALHEQELAERDDIISELQEKLNKKHWWNKEKK